MSSRMLTSCTLPSVMRIKRGDIAMQVQQRMHLHCRFVLAKLGPGKQGAAKIDGGQIQSVQIFDLTPPRWDREHTTVVRSRLRPAQSLRRSANPATRWRRLEWNVRSYS